MKYQTTFVSTLKEITRNFFALLKTNRMLLVEMFFRFENKEIKDQILNNYEESASGPKGADREAVQFAEDADDNPEGNASLFA